MRAYHLRIVLHTKYPISSSQPHTPDHFIPSSLWQHLPAHTHKPSSSSLTQPHPDYRFGQIRIDWVDFESMSKPLFGGKEKEQQGRGTASATFVPHTRTKSGSTNLPEGVVHVFRDAAKPNTETSEILAPSDSVRTVIDDAETDGIMLAVLAVPSWMTPSDFLAFVAPAAEGMAHLRMIRKMEDAVEFAEAYNGKPFNSMEASPIFLALPSLCPDGQARRPARNVSSISRLGSAQAPMYELPTCPVCLERMDSAVTGLVTVPCSHTFHCMCLSKWGDSRCPVCRYSQTLRTSHPSSSNTTLPIPFANPTSPTLSTCFDCSSTTNLWICLICGNIGCGRYGRAHAHAHYERTTHLYALELETQRVWDYAGDGYVHRLIQNKADGKLVELPSASMRAGGGGPSAADSLGAEKIEAIGIEYSSLEELRRAVETERERARVEEEERRREDAARVAELERDRARAERRAEKMTEVARKFEKELREERAVSEGLLKNLEKSREKAQDVDRERASLSERVRELEDQVRDVMFFLEARTKIEQGEGSVGEAAGGSIELPTPAKNVSKKKKNGKK
ncbi:hypothetical protein EW146_g6771 [Bondarzewia mesenterica]|uniref:RING-type domain-containing protein n=1 Tax=Bondarzewia mesenterica TaxID=1095465 RepID=A0A4S4LNJ6_9AGAM|nr:hypothetical protein EW146_g6771 [Bondarzewia mesenterica]